jgi:hypothetical protein
MDRIIYTNGTFTTEDTALVDLDTLLDDDTLAELIANYENYADIEAELAHYGYTCSCL